MQQVSTQILVCRQRGAYIYIYIYIHMYIYIYLYLYRVKGSPILSFFIFSITGCLPARVLPQPRLDTQIKLLLSLFVVAMNS